MGTFEPSYPFYWKKMAETNKKTNYALFSCITIKRDVDLRSILPYQYQIISPMSLMVFLIHYMLPLHICLKHFKDLLKTEFYIFVQEEWKHNASLFVSRSNNLLSILNHTSFTSIASSSPLLTLINILSHTNNDAYLKDLN